MRAHTRKVFQQTLLWCVLDACSAYVSAVMAFEASPYSQFATESDALPWRELVGVGALALLFLNYVASNHSPRRSDKLWLLAAKCGVTSLTSILIVTLVAAFFYFINIGRTILSLAFVFLTALTFLTRFIRQVFARTSRETLLIISPNPDQYAEQVDQIERAGDYQVLRLPTVNMTDTQLAAFCVQKGVQEIVILEEEISQSVFYLVIKAFRAGIRVTDYVTFIEKYLHRVPIDSISASWFVRANIEIGHPAYRLLKRLSDIVLSAFGLMLSLPLILLSCLLIRLESKGSPIYSQIRVGQFNNPFRIWKLRSMVTDSEKNGAVWAKKGDARITRVGLFLRRTRLDELPQLVNILLGDMSFVGPRPERPEFVAMLEKEIPFYDQRHLVKPGLTGWAQINNDYGASVSDAKVKLAYDLYYIKHLSLVLDLHVTFRTTGVFMKGAR